MLEPENRNCTQNKQQLLQYTTAKASTMIKSGPCNLSPSQPVKQFAKAGNPQNDTSHVAIHFVTNHKISTTVFKSINAYRFNIVTRVLGSVTTDKHKLKHCNLQKMHSFLKPPQRVKLNFQTRGDSKSYKTSCDCNMQYQPIMSATFKVSILSYARELTTILQYFPINTQKFQLIHVAYRSCLT